MVTINIRPITLRIKLLILSLTSFCTTINLAKSAIIDKNILIKIVTSGLNPNFKNKYEIGKFKISSPPTTDW